VFLSSRAVCVLSGQQFQFGGPKERWGRFTQATVERCVGLPGTIHHSGGMESELKDRDDGWLLVKPSQPTITRCCVQLAYGLCAKSL